MDKVPEFGLSLRASGLQFKEIQHPDYTVDIHLT